MQFSFDDLLPSHFHSAREILHVKGFSACRTLVLDVSFLTYAHVQA